MAFELYSNSHLQITSDVDFFTKLFEMVMNRYVSFFKSFNKIVTKDLKDKGWGDIIQHHSATEIEWQFLPQFNAILHSMSNKAKKNKYKIKDIILNFFVEDKYYNNEFNTIMQYVYLHIDEIHSECYKMLVDPADTSTWIYNLDYLMFHIVGSKNPYLSHEHASYDMVKTILSDFNKIKNNSLWKVIKPNSKLWIILYDYFSGKIDNIINILKSESTNNATILDDYYDFILNFFNVLLNIDKNYQLYIDEINSVSKRLLFPFKDGYITPYEVIIAQGVAEYKHYSIKVKLFKDRVVFLPYLNPDYLKNIVETRINPKSNFTDIINELIQNKDNKEYKKQFLQKLLPNYKIEDHDVDYMIEHLFRQFTRAWYVLTPSKNKLFPIINGGVGLDEFPKNKKIQDIEEVSGLKDGASEDDNVLGTWKWILAISFILGIISVYILIRKYHYRKRIRRT